MTDTIALTERITDDKGLINISGTDNPKATWFVVHTYSGHENKVAITLKQRVLDGESPFLLTQTILSIREEIRL